MWFCDCVISDSLLALSVHGKTVLFHLSLRQAHMSTTCQVGGDPVKGHVDEPGPQYMRVMAGGWGGGRERQDHREAASSEVGDRMAVTCLIPPREAWSRRTPDHSLA